MEGKGEKEGLPKLVKRPMRSRGRRIPSRTGMERSMRTTLEE
jgi:hypothetical protein